MSSHGRTIILSIHQPRYSIYRLFDSLTLLVSGKQVYHGPAQSALDYFSNIGETKSLENVMFLVILNHTPPANHSVASALCWQTKL